MSERNRKIVNGIRNSALIQNPVLFEAIGIAPIAAIAVSLKTAIILAVASCLELVIIELFTCLVLKKVKSYFRMPVYAALGVLINLPVFMFFAKFTPNETLNVGIFLPLLAVNSLIALHCERFAVKNKLKDTFVDAISAAAGYAFVLLLVGTAREILGSGTIYSIDLHLPVQLSGLLTPFGGLLLVGFLAAAVKALIAKRYPEEKPEDAFRMQEISESHVGSFRTLAQSDFNPYDDTEDEDSPRVKREKTKKEKPVKEKRGKNKPKKEKVKKEKTKKAGKAPKKETHADINAVEAPQSVPTVSTPDGAAERPVRRARREEDDYLLEFDAMLSELDSYKKKQHEKAEEAEKAAEAPAKSEKKTAENTESSAAQVTPAAEETAPAAEKPKPKSKAKSKAKAEKEPKTKSKAKSETEPKTKSKAKSESEPKTKSKAKTESAATPKSKKKTEGAQKETAEAEKPAKKKAATKKKTTPKAKTPEIKQEGGEEK